MQSRTYSFSTNDLDQKQHDQMLISVHSRSNRNSNERRSYADNKNVDIEVSAHERISVITFIRYAHNQKIGKPNNVNVFGSK